MFAQERLNEIISQFYRAVSSEINVKAVYLFGSYAKGTNTPYSDIDLAIVSDDFEGVRFDDNKRLHKFTLKLSPYIETHPFKTSDFISDNPFVAEILKTGKKIA